MKKVRFLRNWDFWPSAGVCMVNLAGEEKKVTEAQYEAASAAGAVELINGEGVEPGAAAGEAGGASAKGKNASRTRD